MGGPEAIRGYLLQTIIALLESLKKPNCWINLELEPEDNSEKVDIKFQYPDKIKVIQVKSSKNLITKPMVKNWCEELKKDTGPDEYELQLLGPAYSSGAYTLIESGEFNGVKLLQPELIDLNNLVDLCAFRISIFAFNEESLSIFPHLSKDIVTSLITQLLLSSTTKIIISREDLKQRILTMISQTKGVVKLSFSDNDINRIEQSMKAHFLGSQILIKTFLIILP